MTNSSEFTLIFMEQSWILTIGGIQNIKKKGTGKVACAELRQYFAFSCEE